MSNFFLRYAQNNERYNVPRVAFERGIGLSKKCFFAVCVIVLQNNANCNQNAEQLSFTSSILMVSFKLNGKCSARGVSVRESEQEGTGEGEGNA